VIADLKEELAFLESDNHRLRHQAFSAGTTKVETMNLEEQIKVRPCFSFTACCFEGLIGRIDHRMTEKEGRRKERWRDWRRRSRPWWFPYGRNTSATTTLLRQERRSFKGIVSVEGVFAKRFSLSPPP
jgi:hypothetical protein